MSSEAEKFISNLRYMSSGGSYYNKEDKRYKWDYNKLLVTLVNYGVSTDDISKVIDRIKKNTIAELESSQQVKTPPPKDIFRGKDMEFQFIQHWLNSQKGMVSDTGDIRKDGETNSISTLLGFILEYNNEILSSSLAKEEARSLVLNTSQSMISSILNRVVDAHIQSRKKVILEKVAYNPAARKDLLETTLKHVVKANNHEDLSAYIAGIKHWMWQVKRRMFDSSAESIYQLMLVFYGEQNVGKSKFVKAFISPWEGLADGGMDFKESLDPRNTNMHCHRAILTIDELTGMDRQALEAIKSFITVDSKVSRVLGTNSRESVVIRTSLIGSTNRHIIDLIYDPTGMRRFLEIPFGSKRPLTKEQINEVFLTAQEMWQSIDENDVSPIDYTVFPETFAKLQSIQKQQIRKDPVQMYITEFDLVPKEDEMVIPIPLGSLYPEFRKWLRREGLTEIGKETFGRMLTYHMHVLQGVLYISRNVTKILPQYEFGKTKEEDILL